MRQPGNRTIVNMVMLVFAVMLISSLVAVAAYAANDGILPGFDKNSNVIPPGYVNAEAHKAKNIEDKARGDNHSTAGERARWFQNPHDTRGQGNMGKPDMRDPYGFDKDSDRIGSERGRRIMEEAALDLPAITDIDFTVSDAYLNYMYANYDYWKQRAENNPDDPVAAKYVEYFEEFIARYLSYDHQWLILGWSIPEYDPSSIEYVIVFTPPDGFEGTVLSVTAVLTCMNGYDGEEGRHYDAGEVIMQETTGITLGPDNTFVYTFTPSTDLVDEGVGFYAELSVTVFEPESGETYIVTYDKPLLLYLFGSLGDNL